MTERLLPTLDERTDAAHPDVRRVTRITDRYRRGYLSPDEVLRMLASPRRVASIDPAAGRFCGVAFLSPVPLRVPFPMDVSGLGGITQVGQLFPDDVPHVELLGILRRTLAEYVRRIPRALALPGFATFSSEAIAADYASEFPVPIHRDGRTIWYERVDVALGLRPPS